jgi:hypothetical protein
MSRIADFWSIYKRYRQYHPAQYAARIAWGIAVKRLPF